MNGDSFKEHVVFEKIAQFNQTYENVRQTLTDEQYLYFQSAFEFINDRLKLVIPALVNETELTTLFNEITATTANLNAFSRDKNPTHMTNARINLVSALNRVKMFPILLPHGDFDFSTTIASFQQTIENAYKNLDKEKNKLQEQLNTLKEDINAKNTLLNTLQKQLAVKENEIQNVVTKYTSEFESIKTNNNTVLESLKMSFIETVDSNKKSLITDLEAIKNESQKLLDEKIENLDTNSNDIITKLNTKQSEAEKIVNLIGDMGVVGKYQSIANEHKKSANTFRGIALAFMIIISGLLIWSIVELTLNHGEFNLYKSLARILTTAALTYPAIYASRESSKHRKLEIQNRKLELELATIGPFIELLSDDKKHLIREELTKKYFGNPIEGAEKNEENISLDGLKKIFKIIAPHLKK